MELSPVQSQSLTSEQKQLQNYKKTFFSAENQAAFETAINEAQAICDANNVKLTFNWNVDPDNGDKIPDGYEFLVAPSNRRINSETVVTGLGVGAIPTYDLLTQSDEGLAFIKSTIQSVISAKFLNAIRPNKSGDIAATIPFTVADFVTIQRSEGMLVAYRKLAPKFIKLLKDKGFEYLYEPTYRQCLQSAVYAESAYPVSQDVWVNIINKMIEVATKEGMQPGHLEEWLLTRDSAGMPEAKEIDTDLSDLAI